MNSRHALLAAKLIFTAGLLWYVASKFDLQEALAQLRNMDAGWMLLLLGIFYVQLGLGALRFREFLRVLGTELDVARAIDASLIGYFFSQTFISFVGGDAMRVLRASQSGISLQIAAKAVILDRASGFAGMMVLILAVLPFTLPRIIDPAMKLSLLLMIAVAVAGAIAVLLAARLPQAFRRFRLFDAVADVASRVLRRITSPRGFAAFFGYSVAINFLNIVLFFLIGTALGIFLDFRDCLILLPPVFFVAMLPISVSGWGIREGVAILALGLAGVPAAQALAISVGYGLGLILISLPGGILWLFVRKKRNPTEESRDAEDQVQRPDRHA